LRLRIQKAVGVGLGLRIPNLRKTRAQRLKMLNLRKTRAQWLEVPHVRKMRARSVVRRK